MEKQNTLSLYQIDQGILDVIGNADENGEIDVAAFDGLQMAKKDKMLNIVYYFSAMAGNEALIDFEIKRLQALKKQRGNKAESLKAYLKRSMETEGVIKMDLGTAVVSIRNNPGSLVIDDEMAIDEKFKKTSTIISIDKMAIKAALTAGEIMTGCHIETSTSLQIK